MCVCIYFYRPLAARFSLYQKNNMMWYDVMCIMFRDYSKKGRIRRRMCCVYTCICVCVIWYSVLYCICFISASILYFDEFVNLFDEIDITRETHTHTHNDIGLFLFDLFVIPKWNERSIELSRKYNTWKAI